MRPGKLVSIPGYYSISDSVSDSASQICSDNNTFEILMSLYDSVRCVDGNVQSSNEYSSVSLALSTSATVSIDIKRRGVML